MAREDRPSRLQVGLLTSGSSFCCAFPPQTNGDSGIVQQSSPVTAARPWPIFTAFPFTPGKLGAPATYNNSFFKGEKKTTFPPPMAIGYSKSCAIPRTREYIICMLFVTREFTGCYVGVLLDCSRWSKCRKWCVLATQFAP